MYSVFVYLAKTFYTSNACPVAQPGLELPLGTAGISPALVISTLAV